MSKSKTSAKNTTTKKTNKQLVESVPATKNRKPVSARRVAVQYTPRIPATRCPWC